MVKLVSHLEYTYETVINGQTVKVKRYSSPKVLVTDEDKQLFNQFYEDYIGDTEEVSDNE